MFKEHKTSKHHFIKGWYIPEKICDHLISYFHTHIEQAQPGRTANFLNKKIKDSLDLRLGEDNKDSKIVEYRNVLQYRKIPYRYTTSIGADGTTSIVFGSGTTDLEDSELIPNPEDYVLPPSLRGAPSGFAP